MGVETSSLRTATGEPNAGYYAIVGSFFTVLHKQGISRAPRVVTGERMHDHLHDQTGDSTHSTCPGGIDCSQLVFLPAQ